MAIERQFMRGNLPWPESTRFVYYNGSPDEVPSDPLDIAFEAEEVIPVFARPHSGRRGFFWEDHSAEIITGDVSEELTMSPFERAQAEYHGTDHRGTPTTDLFDGDLSKFS